jgi:hypothetical protein
MTDIFTDPDGFDAADEPWHICPKDKKPASEFQRQKTVLAMVRKLAPAVFVAAIPNGSDDSDWSRLRKHAEGAQSGMPDLAFFWNHGAFFAVMKSGKGDPSRRQRGILNVLHRQGWRCGVYREPMTLIAHLRDAGAPFAMQIAP